VAQLLDIFGFVSVLLRGLILAFEAITVGGVIFLVCIVRAVPTRIPRLESLLRVFAALLAAAEFCSVAATATVLVNTTDVTWAEAATAGFALAGALIILGALIVAATARRLSADAWLIGGFACTLIVCGSVMGSHAVSRLENRWLLTGFTAVHHIAAAAWIGGIPYLIGALASDASSEVERTITARFSRLAMVSVGLLAAAGVSLSYFYVGSESALRGTTYGIMLLGKTLLTAMLLFLGLRNLQIVRTIRRGLTPVLLPLRRFAEAEAGIGITVFLAAASLTSTPPAVDVPADLVTGKQIAERVTPVWPLLATPPLGALSPVSQLTASPQQVQTLTLEPIRPVKSNNFADIEWSEYNHHWAGLVVLAIGLVALLARRFSWARLWPLLFLGLAVFLFIRADSENWPLGPRGFWESFQVAEVAQHRLFVLLIVLFAVFESAVQTKRLSPSKAGLVFPFVCAAGGALLLTHSHSLINAKEEFLAELSHLPLALLGVAAGWSRWLEIRLPVERRNAVAWIWPVCFVLIGGILLNYREH